MSDPTFELIATFVKTIVVVIVLFVVVALMGWLERRLAGVIQFRLGPNRVGPLGLLQPVADLVKLLFKQDFTPAEANRTLHTLAPAMAIVPALCAFSVVPFGPTVRAFGRAVDLVIVDLRAGILLAVAATSLGVYGIVCAGWSSNNKYSQMGGLRASAQMISYELALALSLIGVLLIAGTLRPLEIVERQAGWFWHWNLFAGWQPLGLLIFVTAGYAETNRLPFDMPEAESELVAGYHTEYSSMRFLMFPIAEYMAMVNASALAVTLFLGGYQLGVPVPFTGWALWILQAVAFAAKVGAFLFLFVWVRWTLPRFRYDQLMMLGWKRLFPLALANVVVTAVLVALDVA